MNDSWRKQLIIKLYVKYPNEAIYECMGRYKYHKLNGPASILINGSKEWWVNHTLHNQNGPAVLSTNRYKAWWVDDVLVKTNEHE